MKIKIEIIPFSKFFWYRTYWRGKLIYITIFGLLIMVDMRKDWMKDA